MTRTECGTKSNPHWGAASTAARTTRARVHTFQPSPAEPCTSQGPPPVCRADVVSAKAEPRPRAEDNPRVAWPWFPHRTASPRRHRRGRVSASGRAHEAAVETPLRDMPPPAIETRRSLPVADILSLPPGHHAGTAFGLEGKRTSGRAGVNTVSRWTPRPGPRGTVWGVACAHAYECVCASAFAELWSGLREAAWLRPGRRGRLCHVPPPERAAVTAQNCGVLSDPSRRPVSGTEGCRGGWAPSPSAGSW